MSNENDIIILDDEKQDVAAMTGATGDYITENPDGGFTQRLQHPFDLNIRRNQVDTKEEISEIVYRCPNGGDILMLTTLKKESDQIEFLFTRTSSHPKQVLHKMHGHDFLRFAELAGRFFPTSPGHGGG